MSMTRIQRTGLTVLITAALLAPGVAIAAPGAPGEPATGQGQATNNGNSSGNNGNSSGNNGNPDGNNGNPDGNNGNPDGNNGNQGQGQNQPGATTGEASVVISGPAFIPIGSQGTITVTITNTGSQGLPQVSGVVRINDETVAIAALGSISPGSSASGSVTIAGSTYASLRVRAEAWTKLGNKNNESLVGSASAWVVVNRPLEVTADPQLNALNEAVYAGQWDLSSGVVVVTVAGQDYAFDAAGILVLNGVTYKATIDWATGGVLGIGPVAVGGK